MTCTDCGKGPAGTYIEDAADKWVCDDCFNKSYKYCPICDVNYEDYCNCK